MRPPSDPRCNFRQRCPRTFGKTNLRQNNGENDLRPSRANRWRSGRIPRRRCAGTAHVGATVGGGWHHFISANRRVARRRDDARERCLDAEMPVQRGPRSDKRARARPIMGLRLELLAEFSSRPSKLGAWSLLAAAKSSFAGASKAATDTCSWPCASCIGGFHASVSLEGNCSNFSSGSAPATPHAKKRRDSTADARPR